MNTNTREKLAEYAHNAWSGWMKYMFSQAPSNADGTWTMSVEMIKRWQRQMYTPYAELPEAEKASDRAEADAILAIMTEQDTEIIQAHLRIQELQMGVKLVHAIVSGYLQDKLDPIPRGALHPIHSILDGLLPKHERARQDD